MPLTVFYPPNEDDLDANADLELDIVAVHGLNGDSHRTWTCKKSKKLWLQEFLPHDLPTGRTMTFGYDATAAFQNSVADIEDHARDLLGCLAEKRQNEVAHRPLIFVAHSLGGHVVKQALVLASRETRYSHIFTNTSAVIFFGTPHQGSDLATYGRTLARIPSAIALVPPPGLLESLIKGSSKLQTLTNDFMRLLNIRTFNIVSFYETKPLLYIRKLVVSKKSALLTPPGEIPVHEHQVPVPADHRKMCQFNSREDKTYKTFVTNVKLILHGGAPEIQNEHFVVSQSENPNFTGRSDIRHLLYESLIKDRHMRKQSQDRFVLYGLGGSGKTQVCLKFAHDHRNKYQSIFWIDASTRPTASQGLLKVARECNQKETVDDTKIWLSSRENWLLIIDNADDPSLDIAEFFPACDRGTIIITSRRPNSRTYASQLSYSYHVDQMSAEDGVSLLLKTALKEIDDEGSRQLGAKVVETLGYLALAIVQAGAVIRQNLCSLETFCNLYMQQKKRLLESGRPPSDYENSVYTTWEISLKQIQIMSCTDPNAVYALELLQTFSFMHFDGISEEIFEKAQKNTWDYREDSLYSATATHPIMPSGWDQLTFAKTLKIMLDFSLITVDSSRRINMHPLVHEWSRERMSPEERVHAWEIAVSTMAMSIYLSYASYEEYMYRRILKPHIAACLSSPEGKSCLFADGLHVEERCYIVDKLVMPYEDAEQYEDALDLQTKNLRLKQLIFQCHHYAVIESTRRISRYWIEMHRYEEAIEYREKILKIWLARDPIWEAYTTELMQDLVHAYCRAGQLDRALEMSDEVIRRCNQQFVINAVTTLTAKLAHSHCLWSLDRNEEAVQIYEALLPDFETTFSKMHPATLSLLNDLADSYWNLGKKKKSRNLREQALAAMKTTLGEHHGQTLTCHLSMLEESHWMERIRKGNIIKTRREALQESQANLGDLHFATLSHMSALARKYFGNGYLDDAKEMQGEAVRGWIKIYGEEHSRTVAEKWKLRRIETAIMTHKMLYWWLPRRIIFKQYREPASPN